MTIADAPRKILATETEVERLPLTGQVLAIARETGSSPLAITQAFARLTFGPGKLSFHDYVRLRLFDPAFHDGADLASFVGQKRNLAICLAANYRHDWFGVLTNKVTSSTYLSAFGLPSLPIDAVFAARSRHRSANLLQNRADLLRFLGASENYPLFGKPADGYQSLGSIALTGFDSADRRLICADGSTIAVDDYLAELEENYSDGYIFQRLLQPDPALKAFGCRGLSCVRVVTAATETGPKVIRAAAKITVRSNSADNYWRAGNLLAQLDLSTGALLRATSGLGLALKSVETHPDTGLPLSSMSYPHWPEVLSLALDGAATMRQVPLIGWDIAATENGVKIVEMNATPDFLLVQLADRRGILDEEFKAFLAFQERNKAAHEKEGRRNYSKL